MHIHSIGLCGGKQPCSAIIMLPSKRKQTEQLQMEIINYFINDETNVTATLSVNCYHAMCCLSDITALVNQKLDK